jgi:hypothetical protein
MLPLATSLLSFREIRGMASTSTTIKQVHIMLSTPIWAPRVWWALRRDVAKGWIIVYMEEMLYVFDDSNTYIWRLKSLIYVTYCTWFELLSRRSFEIKPVSYDAQQIERV